MTVDLSVIIVNWNTRDLLAQCLRSVYDTAEGIRLEVLVVDNASTDRSADMVREHFPQVRLLRNDENVGFARANNQAAVESEGRYLLFLNSDAILQLGAIGSLLGLAEAQPRAGIVGAQLQNPDGSFQASHSPFPNLWHEFSILSGLGRLLYGYWHPSHGPEDEKGPQIVDYVEGACLLVRREAYLSTGGMDEGYFMYAEDVDLCYAMRKQGWQVWYQPAAKVTHVGSGSSRNRRIYREADLYCSRVRFFRKNYGKYASICITAQILAFTAIKLLFHTILCLISRNRLGRPVVPLGYLAMRLKGV